MLRVIGTKLLLLAPVLFLVSVCTFLLVDFVPGDPAVQVLGPNSLPEDYTRIREEMGLNEPIVDRYIDWLSSAVQGDLGRNLVPPVEGVTTRLMRALPVNIQLAVMALGISFAVSVPLAMWAAHRAGSRADRWISASMFGLISVPNFLAGLLLLMILAIRWHVFPLGQWARPTETGWATNLEHAFLPAVTLAMTEVAIFTRLLRSDMISTLQEDYILAAKAKGMPTRHVLLRHALRPSLFSLITLAGVSLGRLIGGTIVIETVFALPGVGRTVIDAASKSDYTLVQGGVLVVAVIYILLNLVVDLLYGLLDPRIRRGRV